MKSTITLICVIITTTLFSCDFCGCFMGITPYDNQSNISVLYRYKMYNGYTNSGQHHNLFQRSFTSNTNNTALTNSNGNYYTSKHGSSGTTTISAKAPRLQSDFELYTTAEVRGKFFIHQRFELNAIIPFVMNSNSMNEKKEKIAGIGDLTFFTAFHVVNKTMTEKFQHRLIFGAGFKLPIGDYYAKNNEGERIDFLMQPGTGSIDYMVYGNYVIGYKKLGLSLNSTYKLNGDNYYHERIGNGTTNYINIFYKFRQEKDFKIFPSIQGYYEYSKGVYINNLLQESTEMNIATGGLGLDIFYKQLLINTSFHIPFYEKKFEYNPMLAGKFMVGLTYNFNQKKYLFKSRTNA